jgi:uncharacterized Zn-finger protein
LLRKFRTRNISEVLILNSIFAAAKSLRAHIRAHHSSEEMVPRCVLCDKIFSTVMNLKSHVSCQMILKSSVAEPEPRSRN